MTEINLEAMTHGGKFHADDVFSAAFLRIMNPDIRILRTFEVPEDFAGIVFDIGFGRFDHHQESAEVRVNGVPYGAFGLLWRAFGENWLIRSDCPEEQARKESAHFDESFIQPLDLDDNTGCGSPVAGMIGMFNPSWDSDKSTEECFDEAVAFASLVLQKKMDSILSVQRARQLVEESLAESKDNIVILPRFAPWKMILVPSDADFVVYPSQRGGFSAQAVPADTSTKELKYRFPEEWAGKSKLELSKLSGIDSLSFCHNSRFLISADYIADIIQACKKARNMHIARYGLSF